MDHPDQNRKRLTIRQHNGKIVYCASGLVRRTRRIPFDRVMEVEIAPSGSAFHLKAVYKMKLPRLIHFILAYWNEKFTMWPLALVTAIPTWQEAEKVQFKLLEAMTKSTPHQGS